MGSAIPRFSVDFSRPDRAVTVAVRGELDADTSDVLRTLLVDVVEGQGNLSVALDLTEMTFIDSSGLALLLDMHQRIAERGGAFVLHGVRRYTQNLLDVVGLSRVLLIA